MHSQSHTPAPKVDVAVNALGRPLQTLLTVASLARFCARSIDTIYVVIDADTPKSHLPTFELLRQIQDVDIEFFFPKVSYNYYDNVVGCYDDYDARMGIRYQYAWENTDKKFLFISHNDCRYTGDIISPMLEAIGDNIILGQLGVCWNCPASWSGLCSRGRYQSYRPTYAELFDLFRRSVVPGGRDFQFRCDLTDFNEKYRRHPWPLPACRVNEWACLVNIEAARPITVPHGEAIPFGATTYIGDILVDTSCEWFHDVHAQGATAKDFPIETYVVHRGGLYTLKSRVEYLQREAEALQALREGGYLDVP